MSPEEQEPIELILTLLSKHTTLQIVNWTEEVLRKTSAEDRQVISKAKRLKWTEFVAHVTQTIRSEDYVLIHDLLKGMVSHKEPGIPIPFGLGNIKEGDSGRLALLMSLNGIRKDPKLESYVFYRFMGGRARLKLGTFNKW